MLLTGVLSVILCVTTSDVGTAVLFDPVQSSTHCDVGCEASIGIDGDSDTNSRTLYGNGSHWWQASMVELAVHQLEIKQFSGHGMTVTLYCNNAIVGRCESHPASYPPLVQTSSCDNVIADKVKLAAAGMEPEEESYLKVYEMKVRGVLNKIITCLAPVIGNGTVSPAGPIANGSSFNVTCNTGFELRGSETLLCSNVQCSSTGSLPTPPSCVKIAPSEESLHDSKSGSQRLGNSVYVVLVFLFVLVRKI